jgi:hypothetical protein
LYPSVMQGGVGVQGNHSEDHDSAREGSWSDLI